MQVKIHPELRDLIPPLDPTEFKNLRKSIKRRGIEEPIVVTRIGDDTYIVDGHNRHEIGTGLGIEIPTRELKFLDNLRDALAAAEEDLVRVTEQRDEYIKEGGRKHAAFVRGDAENKVSTLSEKLRKLESDPEALKEAQMQAAKLYMIERQLSRRNLQRFAAIELAYEREKILQPQRAKQAMLEGANATNAKREGRVTPNGTTRGDSNFREIIAKKTGTSSRTVDRALRVLRDAEAGNPEAEELARELRQPKADESISSAYDKLKREKGEGKPKTIPEDKIANKLIEWAENESPEAVRTRLLALHGGKMDKLNTWLDRVKGETQ